MAITNANPYVATSLPPQTGNYATSGSIQGPDVLIEGQVSNYYLTGLFPANAPHPVGGTFDIIGGTGIADITPDGELTARGAGRIYVTFVHPEFTAIDLEVTISEDLTAAANDALDDLRDLKDEASTFADNAKTSANLAQQAISTVNSRITQGVQVAVAAIQPDLNDLEDKISDLDQEVVDANNKVQKQLNDVITAGNTARSAIAQQVQTVNGVATQVNSQLSQVQAAAASANAAASSAQTSATTASDQRSLAETAKNEATIQATAASSSAFDAYTSAQEAIAAAGQATANNDLPLVINSIDTNTNVVDWKAMPTVAGVPITQSLSAGGIFANTDVSVANGSAADDALKGTSFWIDSTTTDCPPGFTGPSVCVDFYVQGKGRVQYTYEDDKFWTRSSDSTNVFGSWKASTLQSVFDVTGEDLNTVVTSGSYTFTSAINAPVIDSPEDSPIYYLRVNSDLTGDNVIQKMYNYTTNTVFTRYKLNGTWDTFWWNDNATDDCDRIAKDFDLDDITNPGNFYSETDKISNFPAAIPSDANRIILLRVSGIAQGFYFQEVTDTETGEVYRRAYSNSAWTPWQKLAIGGDTSAIVAELGVLASLTTADKSTIVAAINEVDSAVKAIPATVTAVSGKLGDVSTLGTTAKTDVVSAVNEVLALASASSATYDPEVDTYDFDSAPSGFGYISGTKTLIGALFSLDSALRSTFVTQAQAQTLLGDAYSPTNKPKAEDVSLDTTTLPLTTASNLQNAIGQIDQREAALTARVATLESADVPDASQIPFIHLVTGGPIQSTTKTVEGALRDLNTAAGAIADAPSITSGNTDPVASVGNVGDIYFKY